MKDKYDSKLIRKWFTRQKRVTATVLTRRCIIFIVRMCADDDEDDDIENFNDEDVLK